MPIGAHGKGRVDTTPSLLRGGHLPGSAKRDESREPEGPQDSHDIFAIDDIDAVVASLRARGAALVGEVEQYEDSYRLCYVRGPEGIIVELAEQIG